MRNKCCKSTNEYKLIKIRTAKWINIKTFYDLKVFQRELSIREWNVVFACDGNLKMKIIMQARGFVRRSRDLLHKLSKIFTTASHTTNNYSRLPLRGNDSILFIQNAEIIAQPVMRFNLRKINIEMSRPFRANNCHVLRCMFNTFCNLTIFRCLSSDKL